MARILILGGGYGGLRTALRLNSLLGRNRGHEINLVDQNEFHQLIIRLHELAGDSLNYSDILVPFARLLQRTNVRFQRATVTGINLAERLVETTAGTLTYDKLVVALGSETNSFGIRGLKENSFELKSYQDACQLRNHVEQLFAKANDEPDGARRREILTIVIGGGGYTGTELAGELADFRDDLADKYDVPAGEARIMVCEAKDVLLGGFDRGLADMALRILQQKGVEFFLGSGLQSVQDDTIKLSTGQSIKTSTLVWTGGVKASHLIASLGLETGAGGRVVTNPYSESTDYPSVYFVGDCALVLDSQTGRPIASSAQLALQQGSLVAYNISAEIRDLPRLRFKPKLIAEIVSLGRYNAVGLFGTFRFSGLIPSLLKRAVTYRYLYSIGGLGLAAEKLGLGKRTFTKLARAFKRSPLSNRKGTK